MAHPLRGKRILIVEDEYLVATELAYAIGQLGAQVIGPVSTVASALELIDDSLDGAMLDVQLGLTRSDAVADALEARDIPFVLTTGFDASILPESMRRHPKLAKPISSETLRKAVTKAFVGETR